MEAEAIPAEESMNAHPAKLTLENIPNMVASSSSPLRRASYTTTTTASSSNSGGLDASSRKRPYGSMLVDGGDDDLGGSDHAKRMSYTLTEDDCDGLLGDAAQSHQHQQQALPQQPQPLPQQAQPPRPLLHSRPTQPLSASITLPIAHAPAPSSALSASPSLGSMSKPPSPRSSAASPSAAVPASAATSAPQHRADHKNVVASPQEFFTSMLQARGYPATTVCSLKCGYHNSPTKHQTTSYGVSLTKAIRSSDVASAQSLLASGLHPNACNKFGESIVHAACRRGDSPMLRALLAAGSSVQVTDDFGRTPLHDACWTSSPCFEAIRILLDRDPWLLSVTDCRGSTPLGYVRKAHWAVWNGFLGAIADRYWPVLEGPDDPENGRHVAPPLGPMEPNSRPLADPAKEAPSLEVVELLANGRVTPEDLAAEGRSLKPETYRVREDGDIPKVSRITLDPLRKGGNGNATTMTAKSLGAGVKAAPLMPAGFVRVNS